jgi:hypothetical protein
MVNPMVFRDSYLKKQSQFTKGQIDVKSVMTMVYEDVTEWRQRKNKANSKPINGFGLVHRGKTIPIPIQDNRDEAATRQPLTGNPKQNE